MRKYLLLNFRKWSHIKLHQIGSCCISFESLEGTDHYLINYIVYKSTRLKCGGTTGRQEGMLPPELHRLLSSFQGPQLSKPTLFTSVTQIDD